VFTRGVPHQATEVIGMPRKSQKSVNVYNHCDGTNQIPENKPIYFRDI
jgi:hypothetical protein